MGWVVKIISEVRSVRSEMNVPAGAKIPLLPVGASKPMRERAERHEALSNGSRDRDDFSFGKAAPKGSAQIVLGEATVALPLAGVIDMEAERARLTREIDKSRAEIRKIDAKLANESFVAKAPPEVVEENRDRKTDFEATVRKLQAALKRVETAA